jgi:hypothetical protein
MSNHEEERCVKARHDVAQYYQKRSIKRTVSRQDLPRGNLIVEGGFDSSNNNTSFDDEEEETYVPRPQGRGKECYKWQQGW